MIQFAYPFQIDHTGRVAVADQDDHVRELIEQLLFTIPGERVNRPTFGSAVHNLVFMPNNPELTTTIQYMIRSSLQQWLGDVIHVEAVQVESEEAALRVTVQYVLRRTQQRQIAQFQQGPQP
jgi:phage baseplate assembly protein W